MNETRLRQLAAAIDDAQGILTDILDDGIPPVPSIVEIAEQRTLKVIGNHLSHALWLVHQLKGGAAS